MNDPFRNNKTKKIYMVIQEVVNTTNKDDGMVMVLYRPLAQSGPMCVREKTEFLEKFTEIIDD